MFGRSQQTKGLEMPQKCVKMTTTKTTFERSIISSWCEVEKEPLTIKDAAMLDIDVIDSGKILVGLRTKTYEDCEEYTLMQTMYDGDRLGIASCAIAIVAILDSSLTIGELDCTYGQVAWKHATSEMAISVDLVKYRAMCDYDRREVMYLLWSMLGDGGQKRSTDALSGVLVALGIL
jgi:hypothetical protein